MIDKTKSVALLSVSTFFLGDDVVLSSVSLLEYNNHICTTCMDFINRNTHATTRTLILIILVKLQKYLQGILYSVS